MLVGCAHPSGPRPGAGAAHGAAARFHFLDLNGKDMAQDRARTQRLTQALGKQLAIPWWRGSDTHQAVQYGCISTVFARGCHGLRAVGGDAGRPVHHRGGGPGPFQVRAACLLKRALKEVHALGGLCLPAHPGGLVSLLTPPPPWRRGYSRRWGRRGGGPAPGAARSGPQARRTMSPTWTWPSRRISRLLAELTSGSSFWGREAAPPAWTPARPLWIWIPSTAPPTFLHGTGHWAVSWPWQRLDKSSSAWYIILVAAKRFTARRGRRAFCGG